MKEMDFEKALKTVHDQNIENLNKPFTKLPIGSAKRFFDSKLNRNEIIVYVLLLETADKNTGIVTKTSSKLSELSGLPKQSIDNTLCRLEKKKFIFRKTSFNNNGHRTRKIVVFN